VAMDIKASRDNYARAAGLPHMDISRIEESIGILKSSGIPYEFRTTVVKGIHTVGEFKEIGRWIEGCPAYYLQSYQENDNCLYRMTQTAESNAVKPGGAELFGAFSREELERWFPLFVPLRGSRIGELSGGEQRILECFVILRSRTQFVLLDEPFSQISPLHVETLQTLIRQEKMAKGILLTDHMYRHVTGIADRLYVMTDGQAYPCANDEELVRRGYLRRM